MPDCKLDIHLLGGFDVRYCGDLVPPRTWRQSKAAGVVKLLALQRSYRLHREQILESIWPERSSMNAAGNLRLALHRARRGLELAGAPPGIFLVRDGESVVLGPPGFINTDVATFTEAVIRAWQHTDPGFSEQAVAAYGGDLLPDDLYDDCMQSRREALRASHLALLSRLASLYENRGDLPQAIAALERSLSADWLNEATHAALMRLHARSGSKGQALAQYARLEQLLDHEFGARPEPETSELATAIREGRLTFNPARPQSFASSPLSTDSLPIARNSKLPVFLDSFVGRERELGELERLLSANRLLTLTGPGGIGKTRLAIELAGRNQARFPDGTVFVDLSTVSDPVTLIPSVGRAIEVSSVGELVVLDELIDHLRDRRLLLLLDNVEQLSAAGPSIGALVSGCPGLTALITSRIRLRLRGEQEYPVPSLALPETSDLDSRQTTSDITAAPAVELFSLRSTAARPEFKVNDQNAATIGAICRRLDGLPLAIELAAARMRLFTPDQLLAMLVRSLDALGTSSRDAPARQRSLRETIAWSFALLSPEQQTLIQQLSVFVGGWTLDAAAAVCSSACAVDPSLVETLARLIDHSLVFSRPGNGESASRYGMLETICEFARERLSESGQETATRRSHSIYFLDVAETARKALNGPDQTNWLDLLAQEHDNLRAALGFAVETENADMALRLGASLWRFWAQRGHLVEGRAWLERALALPGESPPKVRGDALHYLGNVAVDLHDYGLAANCFAAALQVFERLDDVDGVAVELTGLGLIARNAGRYAETRRNFEQALSIWREHGDRAKVALALHNLGDLSTLEGDYAQARVRHGQALSLRRTLEDANGVAFSLLGLGTADLYLEDIENAEARFEETLSSFRRIGDKQGEAYALYGLGRCAQRRANPAEAGAYYRDSLDLRNRLADRQGVAECLEGIAWVASKCADFSRAARLLGAATTIFESTAGVMTAADRVVRERTEQEILSELGTGRFHRHFDSGKALAIGEAVREVLATS
jgi:predicted ATPase/DNA-binding SARP family transcriptional activator